MKDLGEHPEGGGKITVRDGRYGPYVNHGKVNATLPKDVSPEQVTLEQAVDLIAARAAKGPAKKTRARTPKPKAEGAKAPKARTRKKKAAEVETVDS